MVIRSKRKVDIVLRHHPKHSFERKEAPMVQGLRYHIRFSMTVVSFLLVAFFSSSGGSKQLANNSGSLAQSKSKVVYVCACLKTKSCLCMTEAKMEGPCACGTEGGPPMKALSPDSNWAKENRDELAK